MTNLWRITVVMLFVITILTSVARLVGAIGGSPLAVLFTRPDGYACTPSCLFGIRPGQTRFETAASILAAHPLLRSFEIVSETPLMLASGGTRGSVLIVQPTANGLVKSLSVSSGASRTTVSTTARNFALQDATLGDLVAVLGAPDIVQRGNSIVFFAYLNTGIIVSAAVDNVRPIAAQNPLSTIALVNMPDCPPNSSTTLFTAWSGFTTARQELPTMSTRATKPTGVNAASGLDLCRPSAAH